MARLPVPGTAVPTAISFSPDDRFVTFLWSPERSLRQDLYAMDAATGERHRLAMPTAGVAEDRLSLEERLRRERRRELGQGVSRYAWARDGDRLLVPLPDGVYVADGARGPVRKVVDAGDGVVLEPSLAPDGSAVAFVRGGELNVVAATGGASRQLTSGGEASGRTRGLAEFVAQEEMGRSTGHWWAPDSARLAFAEVDESHVPVFRIAHHGATSPYEAEDHRYPFAGGPNAVVRLGVVEVEGGPPRWLDLSDTDDVYLARAGWTPDGAVVAQVEDRSQSRLDLVRFDPRTGDRTLLLREESDVWINLHDLFRPLERSAGMAGWFVWGSERSGFRHLYLCDGAGGVVRALTAGEWMVDSLDGVDEDAGLVFFSATRDGPTERHLYVVGLDGGQPRRLTDEPGTHHVVVDHAGRRFVDTHSALDRPPTVTLRSTADGQPLHVLDDGADPRVERLGLPPPELVSLPAADGTNLHAAVHRPSRPGPPGPAPTVVSVYGGPHVQRVVNAWSTTADMRAQHLRSRGYLVVVVDNRGSARRGLAFEGAVRHRLGSVEVEDQVAAVRWLVERGLADRERVGIYGWSYGGYLAALCLARAPGTFAAAVAGAPVVHWDGYDTHYTERYMGTPAANPHGYERSSVLSHVGTMSGPVMLIHGLLDENVHFRHTARLVSALNRAGKPYELLLFPDERHLPRREEDRTYMEDRVVDFFLRRLGPG